MIKHTIKSIMAVFTFALLFAGCSTVDQSVVSVEPRAFSDKDRPFEQIHEESRSDSANNDDLNLEGAISLEQALAAALLRNPELKFFSLDVRASEARRLQSGALKNPELEIVMEEYDRDGEGLDSSEMGIMLGQVFELGGKRRWRELIAESECELAVWDYESKRLDVFSDTAIRFVDVLAAQERCELARLAVNLAEKTSDAVGERVQAGKEPALQISKSAAELAMARLNVRTADKALVSARRRLAAMWGAEKALFDAAEGSLNQQFDEIPSLDNLRTKIKMNPDLARWDSELRLRRAALESQKAARIPDLEALVGYMQFEEDGTEALSFGVGFPLPLFDRNLGNIKAAKRDLDKVDTQKAAAQVNAAMELAELHDLLLASHQRVEALRTEVVPAMEKAFDASHEGFQQGKFSLFDVLDAQRRLVETRSDLVDALHEFCVGLIAVRRITGTQINELENKAQENRQ